jgi:hypothetical protein
MPHPNGPAHEMGDYNPAPPKATLEWRYAVFKLSDLRQLSKRDQDTLERIAGKVRDIREKRGALRLMQCVVVEDDWPEYKPTLAAILARVDRENTAVARGVPTVSEGVKR